MEFESIWSLFFRYVYFVVYRFCGGGGGCDCRTTTISCEPRVQELFFNARVYAYAASTVCTYMVYGATLARRCIENEKRGS